MAEINIQKKRMPIWPWLVGLVVIILLVWLIVDGINRNNNQVNTNNSAPSGNLIKVNVQNLEYNEIYPAKGVIPAEKG
jgi:hypothetical protein